MMGKQRSKKPSRATRSTQGKPSQATRMSARATQRDVRSAAPQKKQQSTLRKVFTVIICVVVALGLMLPITGIGVMSCSSTQSQQP
jgi:fatty acid desaturase